MIKPVLIQDFDLDEILDDFQDSEGLNHLHELDVHEKYKKLEDLLCDKYNCLLENEIGYVELTFYNKEMYGAFLLNYSHYIVHSVKDISFYNKI